MSTTIEEWSIVPDYIGDGSGDQQDIMTAICDAIGEGYDGTDCDGVVTGTPEVSVKISMSRLLPSRVGFVTVVLSPSSVKPLIQQGCVLTKQPNHGTEVVQTFSRERRIPASKWHWTNFSMRLVEWQMKRRTQDKCLKKIPTVTRNSARARSWILGRCLSARR